MANTVLPGDKIRDDEKYKLIGPGLQLGSTPDGQSLFSVTRCGLLRQRPTNDAAWVDCDNARYVPAPGDLVIGVITQRLAEGWKVDIGAAELINLSSLSFEGATKRNRPSLKVGDLVYGRITQTLDPEMVCICIDGKARGFGQLSTLGSYLFRSTPSHARKLLSPDCRLFAIIGEKLSYEQTTGVNGWFWIKGNTLKQTICAVKAVQLSRFLTHDQMSELVKRIMTELQMHN